jgi:hypothetical protein
MGPFLLPWTRRNKVEWLLDEYVTAKSLYPEASFSYIGHSNGTYLLAKALELCPAVRFEHVVFGGSVVRHRYNWSGKIPLQVKRVLNYVATGDRVVAIFPQGLERLRLQDLGGAGHLGFDDPNVTNINYVVGGHSAALANNRWSEMANFVLGESAPLEPVPPPSQSREIKRLARWAPGIWLFIVIIVLGIGFLLLLPLGSTGWIWAVSFAIYLYLAKAVLTRA